MPEPLSFSGITGLTEQSARWWMTNMPTVEETDLRFLKKDLLQGDPSLDRNQALVTANLGDNLHPDTIHFSGGGCELPELFCVSEEPSRALGNGNSETANALRIQCQGLLQPVLVRCRSNEKYYTMYWVPQHDKELRKIALGQEESENPGCYLSAHHVKMKNDPAFSLVTNVIANHLGGTLCKGFCTLNDPGRSKQYELIFVTYKAIYRELGWPQLGSLAMYTVVSDKKTSQRWGSYLALEGSDNEAGRWPVPYGSLKAFFHPECTFGAHSEDENSPVIHPTTVFKVGAVPELFQVVLPPVQRDPETAFVKNRCLAAAIQHCFVRPVLVKCVGGVGDHEHYTMYLIQKHNPNLNKLMNLCDDEYGSPPEEFGHQLQLGRPQEFSWMSTSFAYHANGTLCWGKCLLDPSERFMHELLFVSHDEILKSVPEMAITDHYPWDDKKDWYQWDNEDSEDDEDDGGNEVGFESPKKRARNA